MQPQYLGKRDKRTGFNYKIVSKKKCNKKKSAKKSDAMARTCQCRVEIRRLYLETTLFNSPTSLKLPIKRLT